jgi:hypothetical protein
MNEQEFTAKLQELIRQLDGVSESHRKSLEEMVRAAG